jgi:hypothetical protein
MEDMSNECNICLVSLKENLGIAGNNIKMHLTEMGWAV